MAISIIIQQSYREEEKEVEEETWCDAIDSFVWPTKYCSKSDAILISYRFIRQCDIPKTHAINWFLTPIFQISILFLVLNHIHSKMILWSDLSPVLDQFEQNIHKLVIFIFSMIHAFILNYSFVQRCKMCYLSHSVAIGDRWEFWLGNIFRTVESIRLSTISQFSG